MKRVKSQPDESGVGVGILNDPNSNKKQRRDEDPEVSAAPKDSQPPPKYGSKEYWEARYQSHLPGANLMPVNTKANGASKSNSDNNHTFVGNDTKSSNNGGESSSFVLDGVVLTKEATKPGHEWYFSYDELRPLIMPLILGSAAESKEIEGECDEDEESWIEEEETKDEQTSDNDSGEVVEEGQPKCDEEPSTAQTGTQQLKSTSENAQEGSPDVVHQSDLIEKGADTAIHRPKRVLEVGCGDAPLGPSLAFELTSMQSDTGVGAECVVEEVTCIDYSEVVVKSLIEKQKRKQKQNSPSATDGTINTLRPTFQALDARSLPFSSNTYDLVLEKGTLDAMLSDEQEGRSNCITIVKEMARVTNEGGAILIVSHLNANEEKGMGWLEDIVFHGLRDEFQERQKMKRENRKAKPGDSDEDDNEREYVWSVEVHGGDGKYLDANGDEVEENDVGDDAVPIYGPAVYILRKKGVPASVARELFGKKKERTTADDQDKEDVNSDEEDDDILEMPPVRLEFLTY